jgi:anti-sigma regulatory factor (Ser/Thr protein kinase)
VGPVTAAAASDPIHTEDFAWIRVDHASAVGVARRTAANLATDLGFEPTRAHDIEIVISEIAGNQLKHAGSGTLLLRAYRSGAGPGLCCVAIDSGPGIADLDAALRDGQSTAGTLGIGLGAVVRLSDGLDVHTEAGVGTVLAATFGVCDEIHPGAPAGTRTAGLTRPMNGEQVCGDAYAVRRDDEVVTALLVDGLGHGSLAALAAQAALRCFLAAPMGPPAGLLELTHRALRGTRGAAAAIAQVTATELRYAGTGNIGGHLIRGESRRGLTSFPGILGGNARAPREISYALEPHTVIVLHSDGVTDRLRLSPTNGILARTPLVIAGTVLRDHATRNDDAGILVIRPGIPA